MSTLAPTAATGGSALAIICGGGSLPFAVADAAVSRGRRVVLFPLRGFADQQRVTAYPHHWARMGQFNRFLNIAAREGCREVVFIGSVIRPLWWRQLPDLRMLMLIPRILRLYRGGDDQLLSGIGRIFEEYGFHLVGAHEIAPELAMPLGPLGARVPSERDWADIARGLALLTANSPFDIGQAVVIAKNQVLAVEGPEGTDQTVARVAELRRSGRVHTPAGAGVLVKAAKIGQDHRFDLPSIGPQTVEGAAAAGLAGIAVLAGSAIVADADRLIAAADKAGLFVIGVNASGTRP
jgi:hypothetical protein